MTTEERLEKIEQELKETKAGLAAAKRRTRWMLGGGGLLILGCLIYLRIVLIGTIHVNAIHARMLVIEDANGHARTLLAVDKDGPGLIMKDENGAPRAWMNVDKDGPGLHVADKNGKLVWFAP